ncbi:hypothetical protein LCGC14_1753020, partial [marine sediment metagenome]
IPWDNVVKDKRFPEPTYRLFRRFDENAAQIHAERVQAQGLSERREAMGRSVDHVGKEAADYSRQKQEQTYFSEFLAEHGDLELWEDHKETLKFKDIHFSVTDAKTAALCPRKFIIKKKYGPEPKEMIIMFPVENELIFFPQWYKMYGNDVLLCRGDGIVGKYWDFDKGDFMERTCPCGFLEKKKCKGIGILQFLLPEIKEAVGVWQITTGSTNSIKDINGGIKMVKGIAERIAMIPLVLKRVPTKTSKLEKGTVIKGLHFTMQLSLGMSLLELQRMALLPPSRALIPHVNESLEAADDVVVSEHESNGKEKSQELEKDADNEKENTEKAALYLADLTSRKKELSGILEKIYKTDRKIKEDEAIKLDALVTVREYRGAIKYWNNVLESLKTDPA